MVRVSISTGVGIVTAMLVVAGLAAANPIALLEGGAAAAGEASGGYHADATGALDAANDTVGQTAQASSAAHQANDAVTKAKYDAWSQVRSTDAPDMPECTCEEAFGQLDQVGELNVEHADAVQKSAALENEYVDAGVDAEAAGSVKGWFNNLFTGAKDAYKAIEGLFKVDTSATEDAKAVGDSLIGADDELRGQLVSQLDQRPDMPSLDPRAEGEMSASHATEVTSSAVGEVTGGIP